MQIIEMSVGKVARDFAVLILIAVKDRGGAPKGAIRHQRAEEHRDIPRRNASGQSRGHSKFLTLRVNGTPLYFGAHA